MRWIVNLAKSTMIAILVAAPIGNTTVLLLFSISLETLLTVLLFRERRRRLEAVAVESKAAVTLLCRTVPHLRGRHPASPKTLAPARAGSRHLVALANRLTRSHIIGQGEQTEARPVERHVSVAGL